MILAPGPPEVGLWRNTDPGGLAPVLCG